jgi:hypothetical protein
VEGRVGPVGAVRGADGGAHLKGGRRGGKGVRMYGFEWVWPQRLRMASWDSLRSHRPTMEGLKG